VGSAKQEVDRMSTPTPNKSRIAHFWHDDEGTSTETVALTAGA
jgi:hypothetical protein